MHTWMHTLHQILSIHQIYSVFSPSLKQHRTWIFHDILCKTIVFNCTLMTLTCIRKNMQSSMRSLLSEVKKMLLFLNSGSPGTVRSRLSTKTSSNYGPKKPVVFSFLLQWCKSKAQASPGVYGMLWVVLKGKVQKRGKDWLTLFIIFSTSSECSCGKCPYLLVCFSLSNCRVRTYALKFLWD